MIINNNSENYKKKTGLSTLYTFLRSIFYLKIKN